MRKKISLLLLSAILTSCFSIMPQTLANESKKCDEVALEVFSELGLLTSEEMGEANLSSFITRAEFSQYVAKLLNLNYASADVLFMDVPADSFYIKSINGLVGAGILSVPENLMFNPDRTISYNEAVKMAVCAAGYGELAMARGGYPNGYLTVAAEAEMLEDLKISDENALTVGESLQILYNASTVGYYEKNIQGASISYEVSDETLLSKYHNIYLQEGTVLAMNGASVDEGYSAKNDEANIDGLIYTDTAYINESEYLGSFVDFVYRYDRKNDIGKLIYMEKEYPEREMKISSEDFIAYDGDSLSIEYYKNEQKTKKATENIEAGIAVVYNGRPYGGKIADVLKGFSGDYNNGYIYLKDVDKDNSFDYMLINCYTTYVVTGFSDNTLYNNLVVGEKINTEKYENLVVRTSDGLTGALSTAYPYVAEICASNDGKRLEVVLVTNQIKGELSEIADGKITVGESVLEVNEKYFEENSKIWSLGTQVTVLQNRVGEAVYITEGVADDGLGIGYLLKSAYNVDDEYLTFKAYDYTSGEIKTYKADERIMVDGKRYKAAQEQTSLLNAFPETQEIDGKLTIKPQLIRFKADEQNVIKEIDTALVSTEENPGKTLSRVFTYAAKPEWVGWNGGAGRFDVTILYDANITKVISVPNLNEIDVNSVTEKDFSNKVPAELKGEEEKILVPYKFDDSTLYTDILVYTGNMKKEGDYAIMYITSGKGLNDDEVVNTIKVNELGVEKVYPLGEGVGIPDGVTEGDLIALTTDATGDVVGIERMYDREEMKYKDGASHHAIYGDYIYNLPYASSYGYRSVGKQLSRGYVYTKIGTTVQFTYELGNASLEGPGYEMINLTGKPVVIYDSTARDGRKVYTGSLDDVVDYKSAGEDCTYLLMASAGNQLKGIYIYK